MRHAHKFSILTLALLAGLALAAPGHAVVVTYVASLDGTQEVPPNASPASGSGTFTIDTVANTIAVSATFSGLVAPQTAAHIHCCAPPGVNAGVIIPFPIGSPIIGTFGYVEANEANILAGNSYINVHSQVFPGGEIRGQILPPPPSATEQATWGMIKALYK